MITVHIETVSIKELAVIAKGLKARVKLGISLNPATSLVKIKKPYL